MSDLGAPLADCYVLVVEDEYLIARDIRRTLFAAGCASVDLAGDVASAHDLCAQRLPDAAILDIKLYGGDVYELAEMLAEQRIPFIFLTGYDPNGVPDRFARVPCLEKPCAGERVIRKLCTSMPVSF